MPDTPVHYKTITEIAPLLESKQLSPIELTRAMVGRIDDLDGRLRSYATLMADSAMTQAEKAEREIPHWELSGTTPRRPGGGKGPLLYQRCPNDGGREGLQ